MSNIMVQDTPNPNAMKFIVTKAVKTEGKASFRDIKECQHIPLVRHLLAMHEVVQVHLSENVITINQNGTADWDVLTNKVKNVIEKVIDQHDPAFKTQDELTREKLSPELRAIDNILNREIRPALQSDGGDLQVIALKNHILLISYEGACGGCPSSGAGTLSAIQGTLRQEFDPEIIVEAV